MKDVFATANRNVEGGFDHKYHENVNHPGDENRRFNTCTIHGVQKTQNFGIV